MLNIRLRNIDRWFKGSRWFLRTVDVLAVCLMAGVMANLAAITKPGFEEPLSWTNIHWALLNNIWVNVAAAFAVSYYFWLRLLQDYFRQFPLLKKGPNQRLDMWIRLRPKIEPHEIPGALQLPNYRVGPTPYSGYFVVYCIYVLLFTGYMTYSVYPSDLPAIGSRYIWFANAAMIAVAIFGCVVPYALRAIRRAFLTTYQMSFGHSDVSVRRRIGFGRWQEWTAPYSEYRCVLRSEYTRLEKWGRGPFRPVTYRFLELRHEDTHKSLVLWVNEFGEEQPRNWILRIPWLYRARWVALDQRALEDRWREFADKFGLPPTKLPAVG